MAVDGSLIFDTKINTRNFHSGRKSIMDSLDGMKSAVLRLGAAFGAVFGVRQLINFGKNCVSVAREAGDALLGLKSIVEGQGRDFSQAQNFINDYISDGLVPMANAVTAYKNLASRGYDDSQIQSVMLALKDSATYGRQASLTLGYAIQSATEGLKNENSILVDNAGVTKNVSVMWKEYADSIGTTYTNLTRQQKIQAEVNGILTETRFQTGDASRMADSFSGQLSRLTTNFTKFRITVGDVLINAIRPVVAYLNEAIQSMTKFVTTFSKILGLERYSNSASEQDISKNSGISYKDSGLLSETSQVTDEIADSVNNQNKLTEAVEETARAEEKSLAGFDEINTITDNTEIEIQPETVEDTDVIPPQTVEIEPVLTDSVEVTADTDHFETAMAEALGRIKSLLDKLLEPVKIAWDVNGNELVSSAESAVSKIKELIKSIGQSFIDVWTNGTGERYVSNIIILLTDIFNIIGDIAEAFRNAWNDNGTGEALIQSYFDRWNAVLELLHAIAEAFRNVWNNGTGETFIKNILVLFTDIFNIISEITMALQTAWNDNGTGEALIQSYFDRWNNLLELIHTLADDFREVWNNGTGIEVCKNIFEIVTNINETVANLRERFSLAWKENDTGKGIIQSILDIFNIILGTINDITADTEEWSEKLDFSPLLTAIQGLLESLEPLTENIGSGLEWFYKNVLLPLAQWTVEDVIPAFIDLLSGAIDVLNSVIEVLTPLAEWLWDNFLKPIAEWTGGVIVTVIEGIANALKGISDWISEHKTLIQDFIISVATIGAVFGIAGIIQTVISAFTAMGGVIGILVAAELGLQTVTTALSGAFAFITSPITLVCLAIGAVIAIGVLLIKHWDEVKAFAIGMWESIMETMYKFYDWVAGKVEFAKELGKNIVSGLLNGITEFLGNAKQWIKEHIFDPFINGFKSLFGIHSPSTVMAELGGYIIAGLCNAVSDGIGKVKEIFEKILQKIQSVFSKIDEWFKEKFQKAWDNITEIFSSIGNWFSDRWKEIKNIFHSVGEWFGERFRNARDNIADIFSGIGNWFSNRWKDITTALSDVEDWFRDKFQNAWDNITDIFSGIGNWFSDRWNDITTVLSDVGEWFWERFQTARNNVTGIFSDIGNWFSNRWNDITAIFGGVGDWFSEKFRSAYDGITSIFSSIGDFFGGIWSDISDGAKEGVNWIIDIINGLVFSAESAVNFIIDCINSLSFDIPDFVPGIGGTHVGFDIPWVDIPDIPHLAKGTVVPANYGEFLAVLGDNKKEREFVAPESALKNALFEAMSQINNTQGDIVVNVSMFPGERAFQQYIIKAGRNIQSRGGKIF